MQGNKNPWRVDTFGEWCEDVGGEFKHYDNTPNPADNVATCEYKEKVIHHIDTPKSHKNIIEVKSKNGRTMGEGNGQYSGIFRGIPAAIIQSSSNDPASIALLKDGTAKGHQYTP